MINRSGTSSPGAGRKANGLPWLKAEFLTLDKKRARILWAGNPNDPEVIEEIGQNRFDNTVVLKIESIESGKKFLWGLKSDNPCLDILCDGLSEDETTWEQREIWLFLEQKKVSEKKFLRCEVIPLVQKKPEQPKAQPATAGK